MPINLLTPSIRVKGSELAVGRLSSLMRSGPAAPTTAARGTITWASLGSGSTSSDGTLVSGTVITPEPNKPVIIAISSQVGSGTPNTPTAAGCGMTWTAITNSPMGTGTLDKITLFRGISANPTAGPIVFDFGAQTQQSFTWSIVQATGADISGSNAAGAIVQTVANNQVGNVTAVTGTLNALEHPTNHHLSFTVIRANAVITRDSNFSSPASAVSIGSPNQSLATFNAADRTTCVPSFATQSAGIVSLEIKSATNFDPVRRTITPLILNSTASSTDGTSIATGATLHPSPNRVVYAAVVNRHATNAAVIPTATGCNMTWTVERSIVVSGAARLTVFRGISSAPTSGLVTFDWGVETQTSFVISIISCPNTEISGADGGDATVQIIENSVLAGNTTVPGTLSTFENENNIALAFTVLANNNAITPSAGFTELTDANIGASSTALQVAWAKNLTSYSPTFTSSAAGLIMIEVKSLLAA